MKANRPLYQIAHEIRADWKKVNYAAEPYLQAMGTITHISDTYICDSAASVVAYFLGNASSWRGEKAREIKKELNQILKGCY